MKKQELINLLTADEGTIQSREYKIGSDGEYRWTDWETYSVSEDLRLFLDLFWCQDMEFRAKPKQIKVPLTLEQMTSLINKIIHLISSYRVIRVEIVSSDGVRYHLVASYQGYTYNLSPETLMEYKDDDGKFLCNWEDE